MQFVKMQSAGNDYIYVDYSKVAKINLSTLSKNLSRRRFSIGADGIIAVGKINENTVSMKMFNADGSEGNMCGNGVRCAGVFANKYLGITTTDVIVQTKSKEVLVDTKNPRFPTANLGHVNELFTSEYLSEKLAKVGLYVDYRDVFSVNTGNLHLVIFTNDDLLSVSKKINESKLFLSGVNVERVYCIEEADCPLLQIEVYERGSGKTYSCGSGSVAVAYSYFIRKYGEIINGKKVMIKSDGGILQVEFKNNEAYLTGEIKEIYKGEIDEI